MVCKWAGRKGGRREGRERWIGEREEAEMEREGLRIKGGRKDEYNLDRWVER